MPFRLDARSMREAVRKAQDSWRMEKQTPS